jgi:hypothetical protein
MPKIHRPAYNNKTCYMVANIGYVLHSYKHICRLWPIDVSQVQQNNRPLSSYNSFGNSFARSLADLFGQIWPVFN